MIMASDEIQNDPDLERHNPSTVPIINSSGTKIHSAQWIGYPHIKGPSESIQLLFLAAGLTGIQLLWICILLTKKTR